MGRTVRIGISLIVMTGFFFAFLGGERFALLLAKPLTFFQITPSLIKWLVTPAGIASVGFLLILLLTLFFGRIYCSCLCPLGILQDILIFVSRKVIKKRRFFSYQPPRNILRYMLFFLTVISAILGSFALLNLLEPYSFFGRITTQLLQPGVVAVNNLLASILERFHIYAVPTIAFPDRAFIKWLPPILLFALLAVMSVMRGRLYCNTLCPVGALLGLIARFARHRFSFSEKECVSCGLCERICRAGCINVANKSIDSTRCVACFGCVVFCPKSAIRYARVTQTPRQEIIDLTRRRMLLGSVAAAGSLVALSVSLRPFSKHALSHTQALPIIPPGALNNEHFNDTCTACDLCVSACPSRVIQPTLLAHGLRGMMQPAMDYAAGYCTYECNLCGNICPTGAITPLPLAAKKLTQIGQARLDKETCIVYTKKQDCGACAEICPTHAVYTVEKEGVRYPETNLELCIGCGACQFVCPVLPKAIVVEGLATHTVAKEPFYDQQPVQPKPKKEETTDFPF